MHGGDNLYRILVGKFRRMKSLGRTERRLEHNIKMCRRGKMCEGVEWFQVAQDVVL
jgi:hypothetical protein